MVTAKALKRQKIKQSGFDAAFDIVNYIVLTILMIILLYPLIYVISTSISNQGAVMRGKVFLWPVGFDISSYKLMVRHPLFARSYLNTVIYAVSGTIAVLFLTSISAYPLAREKFQSKKVISILYEVTMFFGGGMIPTYLVVKTMGMLDTLWAIILPGALSAWNLLIMRSFFKTIPESLHESAYLDGAKDLTVFMRIVIPLSMVMAFLVGAPTWIVFLCLKCDQILKCAVAVVKVNRYDWIRKLTKDFAS
jgi:putative aldouronate transport system permease protein